MASRDEDETTISDLTKRNPGQGATRDDIPDDPANAVIFGLSSLLIAETQINKTISQDRTENKGHVFSCMDRLLITMSDRGLLTERNSGKRRGAANYTWQTS